jgi:hypothetical protein
MASDKTACDGLSHVRHYPIWPQLALKLRHIGKRRLLICSRHEFDLDILWFWLLFVTSCVHALLMALDKTACASHFACGGQESNLISPKHYLELIQCILHLEYLINDFQGLTKKSGLTLNSSRSIPRNGLWARGVTCSTPAQVSSNAQLSCCAIVGGSQLIINDIVLTL